METEYLQAAVDFWVYIVIAVIGWIFQLYKKAQEKAQQADGGQFLDDKKRDVTSIPTSDLDEVLRKFSVETKQVTKPDRVRPDVKKETPKHETMVSSMKELKEKYSHSITLTNEDRNPENRFGGYEITEEKKNVFAEMLGDSDSLKKAFVLSEIINRKEY